MLDPRGCFIGRGGVERIGAKMLEFTLFDEKLTFLSDCGIGLGPKKQMGKDNIFRPNLGGLIPGHRKILGLTHGHLDHIGSVPELKKQYPELEIFATEPTRGIMEILCRDNIKIRTDRRSTLHYTQSDLDNCLKSIQIIKSEKETVDLGKNCRLRFRSAGHIPGAVTIILENPYGSFADSGDINFQNTTTVKGASLFLEEKIRFLAIESTNGDIDDIDQWEKVIQDLIQDILTVIRNGGKVLIPVFAVGRGLDVAVRIGRELEKHGIKVWSGGLLRQIAKACYCHSWDSSIPFNGNIRMRPSGTEWFGLEKENVYWMTRNREKKNYCYWGRIALEEKVAIVTHGMLEAGLSQVIAILWGSDEKNAIFIPGYQAEETHGRTLIRLKRGDPFTLTSPKTGASQTIQVNALVKKYGLSGHASGNQLAQWVQNIEPWDGKSIDKVFITHGDKTGQVGLQKKLANLPNSPKEIFLGATNKSIPIFA